jgi:NAD(P)-dependent dehydrogenase (short-subunit alcohol dehydrogenase family)
MSIQVNNAGCNLPGSTLDTPLDSIHKQFSANVLASIHVVRAAVPHMPTGGRIINIGSMCSKVGSQALPFYSAAKAALDSLTYTWAAEVSETCFFH